MGRGRATWWTAVVRGDHAAVAQNVNGPFTTCAVARYGREWGLRAACCANAQDRRRWETHPLINLTLATRYEHEKTYLIAAMAYAPS